jgi:glc operon protein GlcG
MALPLLIGKNVLTLATAKKIAEAAEQFAIGKSWNVVIAVVDDGGNLLYLERMDGAPIGSVGVAHEKARTSVIFKAPTKAFEAGLAAGVTSLLKLDILPFEGGVPVTVKGSIVGAIGVSGCAASTQDGEVAEAAAEWFVGAVAAEA